MNNINKIRIIYTDNDEALKEYVKYFFEFIGIMVCEYRIEAFDEYDKVKDLYGISYDKSVVDIALGSVCTIIDDIISENKPLELNLLCVSPNSDISKTQFKEDLLDEIISKLWENAPINLPIITQLRNLFVCSEENRDLFQILYGIEIIRANKKLYLELKQKSNENKVYAPVELRIDAFIQKKIDELVDVYKALFKLSSTECEYIEFAYLNIQKYLKELQTEFSLDFETYFGDNSNYVLDFASLEDKVRQFIVKYPSNISAKYLLIDLEIKDLALCEELKQEGINSQEKKYYSQAVSRKHNSLTYPIKKIEEDLKLAYSFDSLNIEAIYEYAYYMLNSKEKNNSGLEEEKTSLDYAKKILELISVDYIRESYKNPLILNELLRILELKSMISIKKEEQLGLEISAREMTDILSKIMNFEFFIGLYEAKEKESFYQSIMQAFVLNWAKIVGDVLAHTSVKSTKEGETIIKMASKISYSSYDEGNKVKKIGIKQTKVD